MTRQKLDAQRMGQALALAESAIGATEPNPRVGCVIGSETGAIYGTGATQRAGGPHAEIVALRTAQAAGHDLRGATAWVTLEPCAHQGRTPPCTDALIAAGLGRVVVAIVDPFPQVAGQGIARLRAAGIAVDMAQSTAAQAAWELNIGFFSRVLGARPWVRVKVAASLDGRTGLDNGISQWITGETARVDGHRWRMRASAVLTGIGTVLADNPRLDVRLVPSAWQPLRVVVDSALRIPDTARLLPPPGQVLIATAAAHGPRAQALEALGTEVLTLAAPDGRVALPALLATLAHRGVNELHVEAGRELTTSLLRAGLADELLVYLAPRLLGGQRGMVDWPALQRLDESVDFRILEVNTLGEDLRLRLRPARSEGFGSPLFASGLFTAGGEQDSKSPPSH